MKKLLTYLLLLLVGTDTLSLEQLDKLPLFLQHLHTHGQADQSLTLMRFISMHYFGHDLKDDDTVEDMKLPFKKMDTQHVHVFVGQNLESRQAPNFKHVTPINTIWKNNLQPDPALTDTFRPPCA